jgi:DNA-binding MarR family transcriptional regulator
MPSRIAGLPTWLLSQTSTQAHRLLVERLSAVGARGYDYRVLAFLDEQGPASQAGIGRGTAIHLSDMVGTLNGLEAAGHVARLPDPADRRRNVVTLTPAGAARLAELSIEVDRVQDELLAPLSAEEREELTTLLARVLAHHVP